MKPTRDAQTRSPREGQLRRLWPHELDLIAAFAKMAEKRKRVSSSEFSPNPRPEAVSPCILHNLSKFPSWRLQREVSGQESRRQRTGEATSWDLSPANLTQSLKHKLC